MRKRWGFLAILLIVTVILCGASWNPDNYSGQAYTISTTDSMLVKWDNGVRAIINTEPYTQVSFTFRVYDLMGDDAADSIQIHVYTTDFRDEGTADTTDLADYVDVYHVSLTDEGVVHFVLGAADSTSPGKYVAIQIRAWGAGTLTMGDSYLLRGQE